MYDNCLLLSPHSEFLGYIDRSRFWWYLKNKLATFEDAHPPTIKLTFQPKRLGHSNEGLFYQIPRENKCVVCGSRENLSRHHILPKCYQKHMPNTYKRSCTHDILSVCWSCHIEYEKIANHFKNYLVRVIVGEKCLITNLTHQKVLEQFSNPIEFIKLWRKHFVENTKPKHLPPKWNVEHEREEWFDFKMGGIK